MKKYFLYFEGSISSTCLRKACKCASFLLSTFITLIHLLNFIHNLELKVHPSFMLYDLCCMPNKISLKLQAQNLIIKWRWNLPQNSKYCHIDFDQKISNILLSKIIMTDWMSLKTTFYHYLYIENWSINIPSTFFEMNWSEERLCKFISFKFIIDSKIFKNSRRHLES